MGVSNSKLQLKSNFLTVDGGSSSSSAFNSKGNSKWFNMPNNKKKDASSGKKGPKDDKSNMNGGSGSISDFSSINGSETRGGSNVNHNSKEEDNTDTDDQFVENRNQGK